MKTLHLMTKTGDVSNAGCDHCEKLLFKQAPVGTEVEFTNDPKIWENPPKGYKQCEKT